MTDIQIIHELPDRVRLKVPAVRNFRTAQLVEKKAKDIEGIHWARANAKCAGLVIRFDQEVHTCSNIINMLEELTTQGYA